MTHVEIKNVYAQIQKFTYAKIVIDFCPQQEDLHWIQITARGSLTKYKGDLSMQTADLATLKLLWNCIITLKAPTTCVSI
jgi:hypothetical protein